MLQPVNDCYWSPKPRRDDVPVTSAPRHVALPELKHSEVPDSALSILFIPHYASLHYAALYRAIHGTLRSSRYSALLRATPRFSTLCCAILRSYDTLRYTALLYVTLCSTALSALLCASLRSCALNRAPTTLRYTALPRYRATLRSYDTLRCTALLYGAALHCTS